MKKQFLVALSGFLAPFAAFAAREGTPSYYQNNSNYQQSTTPSSSYVGKNGQRQVLGQRTYSYQTPTVQPISSQGTMTANGISLPTSAEPEWLLSADYSRRYATFGFETGVNSILKWNDMVFNEVGVEARHNMSIRDFDMFVVGEYRYGALGTAGLSMDYDLEPYDSSVPSEGIFTISVGDMSGSTNYFRVGIGAHNVWNLGGWKMSPTIGYEIFKHDLEMSNHYYPNPGVYLPLMNQYGDYIYGDEEGNYYALGQDVEAPDDYYQVCLSPEDIMVAASDSSSTHAPIVTSNGDGTYSLVTTTYDSLWDDLPWGVSSGDCVVIGGDGPILVKGTTHIYNTTWSGFYVGLELEKQMTFSDKLRFYVQFGLPNYSSDGTWPNRTDWQQNPSFIDKGSNGAYSYRAEIEYNYKMSDRLNLVIKADTNVFHVGEISGELYVAGYTTWATDEDGQYLWQDVVCSTGTGTCQVPQLVTVDPHTEKIEKSLKSAEWQSFGLHLGVKYEF